MDSGELLTMFASEREPLALLTRERSLIVLVIALLPKRLDIRNGHLVGGPTQVLNTTQRYKSMVNCESCLPDGSQREAQDKIALGSGPSE